LDWAKDDDECDEHAITPTTVPPIPSPSSPSPVPASSRPTTCHFFELELETIEESSEEENDDDDDESSSFGEEDLLLTPVLTPHDFARSQPPMEEVMELLTSVDETPVQISCKLGLSHSLPQRTFDDVADLEDQIRTPSPCPSLESPFSSPSADYLLPEADFPYPSTHSLLPPTTQHYTEAPQPTIWEIEALLDIQKTDKIAVEPTQSFLRPKLPWVTAPPISQSTSDELPMSSFELDQMLLYSPRESILAMLGIRPTPEILDIIVNVPQVLDTSGLELLSTVSTTSSDSLDVLAAVAGFQQRLPGC
jgi:hypothetical protein